MTNDVKPFRAYDNKTLADTYNMVLQMQANIELMLSKEENKSAADLPTSIVPTEMLYIILLCYDAMYKLLSNDHLIKNGHAKHSSTTIH